MYESRYGTAKKAAGYIASKLGSAAEMMTSGKAAKKDPGDFDNIIIGGSIMMGKIQKKISDYIDANMDTLLKKRIALFLAAANTEKEGLEKEINDAFPKRLRDVSLYTAHAGYAYVFEKMNFIFKAIIKKMANTDKSVENINYEELDRIVQIING